MRDMVVFGEDWGRHPSSTQHLVRRLAGEAQIIWVNSLGLRRPRLRFADFDRLRVKALSLVGEKRSRNKDVSGGSPFAAIIHPRTIPWPGSRLAAWFNRASLRQQIGQVMAAAKMTRPIVWTSLPTALPVVGALNEYALVYYAGDDFGALAGVDHRPVLAMEKKLADKADLIIAASPQIAERFSAEKTRVLAHGVDYVQFAGPVPRAADLPSGRPIAGFYGSISEWIDTEALAQAAAALPGWDFVLIGRIETDVTTLKHHPNIHLLGPRTHGQLASYCQHWDVSLLPFKRSRQIDASNPLKLREYLAAGKPVLASYDFPAAVSFSEAIIIAGQGETFSEAILRAHADKRPKTFRQSFVLKESWQSRAATLKQWLEEL
jgi:glycosyltransferase involved in cell wall biosynthesis